MLNGLYFFLKGISMGLPAGVSSVAFIITAHE